MNKSCCNYLGLLGDLVKLPVDDHPADEHEEEDEAGRHPLELVVDGKVGVEVQHLSRQCQHVQFQTSAMSKMNVREPW